MPSNKEPCMNCMKENPVFLHNLYLNNTALQFCSSCVLVTFTGAYCPICFLIFESEHFNSTPKPFRCSTCPAVAHFSCVYHLSATTSKSATASSIPPARYICPTCSDPNFKFFSCERDEETQTARINKHLCQELLAASTLSHRCMKEAKNWWQTRVEILAQEAADARKRAKQALEKLAELTMAHQDSDGDDSEEIDEDEDSDEDVESEESHSEGNNSEEIDEEGNDSDEMNSKVISGEDSNDEE